jgi:hypothetical protein
MSISEEVKRAAISVSPEDAGYAAEAAYVIAGLLFSMKLDEAKGHLQRIIAVIEVLPKQDRINLEALKKTDQFLDAVMGKFGEVLVKRTR